MVFRKMCTEKYIKETKFITIVTKHQKFQFAMKKIRQIGKAERSRQWALKLTFEFQLWFHCKIKAILLFDKKDRLYTKETRKVNELGYVSL